MFSNEQHKILYVKKHTRSIVYNTIKHCVKTNNKNLYITIKKFIQNLKQTFDKKNKMSKTIDELFNFDFRIKFKNKNETFNEFLIYFNNLTTFVKFQTEIKIKYFRDKFTNKIRFKILYLKICID